MVISMKRKLSAAAAMLMVFLLIVGCTETPEDVSSAENTSTGSSATGESSFVSGYESAEETSADDLSEETTSDDFSDPSSGTSSSGGFSPWQEPGEPDLGNLHLPSIPEEGFSFLTRSLTLWSGESATVWYEFKPVGVTDRKLIWSSSNESVVTVEDGHVVAVGIGKATVRAETSGGRHAECRVTVVEQGTLSPLGSLAATLADGNFSGLQFAKYDAELDGTAELFVRRIGAGGVPVVTVYRENGEKLLTVSTGMDEEWAIWRRKSGGRYLLLSYTQSTETGGTRYVLDEITASGGRPVRKSIFARETASDGTVTYYQGSDGKLVACSEDTYQRQRKIYFSENRQLPQTVLTWVKGQTAGEVNEALRKSKLPG